MCFWFTFGHLGRARRITIRSFEYRGMSVYMVYEIKVQAWGWVGVECWKGFGNLPSDNVYYYSCLWSFLSLLYQRQREQESEKALWEGTREWVSYSCFYLSCRCNAFGPNANCLGHTRFIQIDLALLSGNGLLNVNFRINSTRAAQTITLCLGEVGCGGAGWGAKGECQEVVPKREGKGKLNRWSFKKDIGVWFFFPNTLP